MSLLHFPAVASVGRCQRRSRSALLGCALLATLVFPLHAAEQDQPVAWRRASLPGFEIYSDVPNARTRDVLYQFSLLCRDGELLWPVPQAKTAAPDVVILSFDPPAIDLRLTMGGIMNGPPHVQRTDPRMLLLNFRCTMGGGDYQHYWGAKILQDQYSTRFLALLGEQVPPWVSEGVGKLIRGMCCAESSIELPALTTDPTLPIRIRTRGSEASLKQALRNKTFLPLKELFSATESGPVSGKRILISVNGKYMQGPQHKDFWENLPSGTFVDEAYEFSHFCLFAENGKYRAAFIKFVYAACNGPLEEAGFEKLFGADYDTMLLKLWQYTAPSTDLVYPLASGGAGPVPAVVFQPATKADITSLRATWAKTRIPPRPPLPKDLPASLRDRLRPPFIPPSDFPTPSFRFPDENVPIPR